MQLHIYKCTHFILCCVSALKTVIIGFGPSLRSRQKISEFGDHFIQYQDCSLEVDLLYFSQG